MSSPVVKYTRDGNIHSIDFGIPAMGTISIDYDEVPKEERAGIAKALLSAAALFCYGSTLGTALTTRAANFSKIESTATLALGENENKQARVTGINLSTIVELSEDDEEIFNRCQKIMRNGCIVTSSIHEGIHMDYKLDAEYDD